MLSLRDSYFLPQPAEAIELRAFTHGLQPKTVPAMMQRFVEDWQRYGVDAWNEVPNHWKSGSGEKVGWWSLPEYLGDAFVAPLLGAPAGTCVLQLNVHDTMQRLLSCINQQQSRRRIVTTFDAFPSVGHSLRRWMQLLDIEPIIVPPGPDGFIDPEAILNAINDQTAYVILNHVSFLTGERLPDDQIRAFGDAAHRKGALLVLDGYHGIGAFEQGVEAMGVDVYMGGLLKQGSGSSGNGFLYIQKGLDLNPAMTGWVGDGNPFGFEPQPTTHPTVRRRFLGGTPAIASMYHAVEGARILLDAGLDTVRSDSLTKSEQGMQAADRLGLPLRSPRQPERRGTMLVLEMPDAYALCEHLKQHHIYTDSRQNRYLRLAPFVWNTTEEIDRVFDTIHRVIEEGAYRETSSSSHGPVT